MAGAVLCARWRCGRAIFLAGAGNREMRVVVEVNVLRWPFPFSFGGSLVRNARFGDFDM